MDPDSAIARQMKDTIRQSEAIRNAWVDAVSDSLVNFRMQDGQKKNAQEGVRYSLRGTTDGRTVAVVDEDILSNIDLTQWNKQTKKEVQAAAKEALKKFGNGIVVDGITRSVNKVSRNEYTGSKYSEKISKTMPQLYADKMRAASAIDDVVIATTDWARDGKLLHPRTDNFVDFDHGNVLIEAGKNQYAAEVVVGITDRGNAVFYDVVDIQLTQFTIIKEEPSPNVTTNKSPDIAYESSSKDRVPQQTTEVKGNVRYSSRTRQDSQIDRLTAQNEKLQQEADYLRQLVQIQKSGNKDFILDRNSVKKQAGKLMASANANGDTGEFSRMLNDFYHRMHTDSEITWDAMQEDAGAIADTVDVDMPDRLADIVRWANSSKEEKKETHPTILKVGCVSLAERVGFEPTVRCRITSFQDWLLKPLGHLSIGIHDSILHLESQG